MSEPVGRRRSAVADAADPSRLAEFQQGKRGDNEWNDVLPLPPGGARTDARRARPGPGGTRG